MIPFFLLRMMSPMVILGVLCAIFYSALYYYGSSVLDGTTNIALIERVMALRMTFSGAFCVLLGYIGVKLTGHVWPAMVVHTLAVSGLLLMDVSFASMVQNWDITLLILSGVAALTGVAGGLSLALLWLRMKYPRIQRRRRP